MAFSKSKSRGVGSVWGLVTDASSAPSISQAKKQKDLLAFWGENPLNFILGEDYEEREVLLGSGIHSKKLIWTSDELDDNAPLKSFPEWEYIQRYITVLHEEDEVISDKARQMYVTTATLQYIMWNCLFRYGRRWIWTKATEDESIFHLDNKIRKVHQRLPKWVREALPITDSPQDTVTCLKTHSTIIAGAENVAIRAARGGTATGFGLDEGAFMEQFQTAWSAAAPMAKKLIALTTPNIGTRGAAAYYAYLERDQARFIGEQSQSSKSLKVNELAPIEGFNVRRNSSGYTIVEIDLEANPEKRTPEFRAALHRRQPNEREFRREYLRDWTVAAGEGYYPEWGVNGGSDLYVKPIGTLIEGPIFRAWDFGFRSPACVFFQIDPRDERVWVVREVRGKNMNIFAFADLVMVLSGEVGLEDLSEETEYEVRKWVDQLTASPYYPDPPWFDWEGGIPPRFVDLGGPEATFLDSKYDKTSKENTDAEILENRGIFLSITGAQWNARENVMRKLMRVREDGIPGILFDPACKELVEAFAGALCYAMPTPQNPLPDAPAKNGTHDHLHDALSYGLVQVVGLDEPTLRDGRFGAKRRLGATPAQSLLGRESDRTSNAFTEAARPRLSQVYR